MKKLRLDFKNRIVNIVTDQKTVIAYMDESLNKRDFLVFFPPDKDFEGTNNVTFDFENSYICLKRPVAQSDSTDGIKEYKCVKRIPAPELPEERQNILKTIGWNEP